VALGALWSRQGAVRGYRFDRRRSEVHAGVDRPAGETL